MNLIRFVRKTLAERRMAEARRIEMLALLDSISDLERAGHEIPPAWLDRFAELGGWKR